MGLDWVLQRKIKEENIDEGTALLDEYEVATPVRREEIDKMLDEISLSPFEAIGCPMIGRDEVATAWLRNKYVEKPEMFVEYLEPTGTNTRRLTWPEAFEKSKGQYVAELANDQEGLGSVTGLLAEETSFRGKLVGYCQDIIGDKLSSEAYTDMSSERMMSYADDIENAAKRSANKLPEEYKQTALGILSGELLHSERGDEYADDHFMLNYVTIFMACKWLRYWGNKGFSMWAWY